ncbi:MAG: ABC transporter ATP-binding protein [Bacteroidales bacterium]|nr:ABC transporter ATP-binding protein [Bacteroidales bacterium]
MINEKAIIIKGLSKEYYKKDSSHSGFFDKLKPNKTGQSFFALKDINLEINRGEVIGIIGPNGAGKSTLLKILAEVTPPTSGSVEIFGKVASILEIGIGFQPELSGYDNIFLSGKLYGLSRKQIRLKLDKIIEMFGFPDFINTEVKHYSSGMYMRLAFSIIINIEADIYLFDEILSVGDDAFQGKAIAEINKLKETSKTVLIVTHTPKQLAHLFTHLVVLTNGIVEAYGNTVSFFRRDTTHSRFGSINNKINKLVDNETNKISYYKKNDISFELSSFDLCNKVIKSADQINGDTEIILDVKYKYKSYTDLKLVIHISNSSQICLSSCVLKLRKNSELEACETTIEFPPNIFNTSIYNLDLTILDQENDLLFAYRNIAKLFIENSDTSVPEGLINLPYTFLHKTVV